MPDFEERELVERAKEDPDAFGALYDRYFPQIYRFAYSRVRDQSLAEDVTSEVFFKALRNIKRYTYSGHPFSSWLYQITLNAVADHYRGQHGEVELEEGASLPSGAPNVDDEVVRRDRSRRVWSPTDQLPRHQRAAMVLKFGEDKKIEEIAQIMGKSAGAVKLGIQIYLHNQSPTSAMVAVDLSHLQNKTNVATGEPIVIRFTGPIDKNAIADTVVIEPATSVTKQWVGQNLVIIPDHPLAPNTTYTVSLKPRAVPPTPNPASPTSTPRPEPAPTPVVAHFTPAKPPVAPAFPPSDLRPNLT